MKIVCLGLHDLGYRLNIYYDRKGIIIMNTWQLFFNEIKYRWVGCLFAILAVGVSLFTVTSTRYFLADFDKQTQSEISKLQQKSYERMCNLENEARVFAKSLGFNIFIFNDEQKVEDFYIKDMNTDYLTNDDANRLAKAKVPLLNHLLPFLRHKIFLKSLGDDVIIAGIEGEIFIRKAFQKPMEVKVEPGEVQLGATIAKRLHLKINDKIMIGDKEYIVTFCREPLGTKDDIVIFMNLGDAQTLLNLKDKISGILAISCNCTAGNVALIHRTVQKTIPNANVVEFTIRAKARQRARRAISKAADEQIADIVTSRTAMRSKLKRFSLIFSILMVIATSALLFFLYAHNVKERRHEIAILRTLGVSTAKIILIFAGKSILLATAGGILGFFAAILATIYLITGSEFATLFNGKYLLILVLTANLISIIASLIPAMIAAYRDPGIVLNEEA